MATYLEEYQYYLEDLMAKGGKPDVMEEAVQQYNAIGRVDFRPGKTYVEWATKTPFRCTTCAATFDFKKGESPRPIDTLPPPSQEVTCEACLERAVQAVRDTPADGPGPTESAPPKVGGA